MRLLGTSAERRVSADEPADDHPQESGRRPEPDGRACSRITRLSASSTGKSCRRCCRGCSAIRWSPTPRRSPKSTFSFRATAWAGCPKAVRAAAPADAAGRRAGRDRLRRHRTVHRKAAAPAATAGWVVGRVGGPTDLEPLESKLELPACPGHRAGAGHDPAIRSAIAGFRHPELQAAEPGWDDERRVATD